MQLENFDNAIPHIVYFSNRHATPNWQISTSTIGFIDLTYIIKGSAIYTINGQRILAEEGDVICIPKQATRAAKSPNPSQFECFATNFSLHTIEAEELTIPLPILSHVGIQNDIISLYRKLNENWLSRNPGYTMRCRAEFMLVLQRIFSILVYEVDTYQYDPRVKQAIRYISDNFAEPLTIAAVADAVSLNPVYFGSLFKKETRTTFRDYLNTIRLNQAEDMLRTKKLNVTEVAQSCGFTDVFYFSRLFKKQKGIPPSSVQ